MRHISHCLLNLKTYQSCLCTFLHSWTELGNLKAKTLCAFGVDLAMQGKTLVMQPRK